MSFTIRPAVPDDWQAFIPLRTRALTDYAQYMNPTGELPQTEAEARELIGRTDRVYFMLFDSGKPIGITGLKVREDARGRYAAFASSYIVPEYQGQGLSRLLYEARFEYARNVAKVKRILIDHRDTNTASARAVQARGFVKTGERAADFRDGTKGILVDYELILP